jgi:hypothetical protein
MPKISISLSGDIAYKLKKQRGENKSLNEIVKEIVLQYANRELALEAKKLTEYIGVCASCRHLEVLRVEIFCNIHGNVSGVLRCKNYAPEKDEKKES